MPIVKFVSFCEFSKLIKTSALTFGNQADVFQIKPFFMGDFGSGEMQNDKQTWQELVMISDVLGESTGLP